MFMKANYSYLQLNIIYELLNIMVYKSKLN